MGDRRRRHAHSRWFGPLRRADGRHVIDVKDVEGGASFAVKASAGAKRNAVVGLHGDALKVAVSAPRDKGKANEALIDVIAEALGVPKKTVTLIKGETSTEKR